jgi:predicted transcriptional regulator
MKTIGRPSELELQVLAVLWREGAATAREVSERMPDGKARAYTTVLSVLQVLEKKGLVKHRPDGRAHRYSAVVTKRQVLGPMLRQLVTNVFGGSPSTAVQHLLAENKVTAEEMDEIRALIAEHDAAAKRERE